MIRIDEFARDGQKRWPWEMRFAFSKCSDTKIWPANFTHSCRTINQATCSLFPQNLKAFLIPPLYLLDTYFVYFGCVSRRIPWAIYTMFQRTLLRQSRTLQSQFQTRSISNTISTARRAQSPFLSTSHIGPISRLPRRWVSTDAEEKTLGENGKETSSEAPKEEANPLQKEVEAKNKEIIDLKVCAKWFPSQHLMVFVVVYLYFPITKSRPFWLTCPDPYRTATSAP